MNRLMLYSELEDKVMDDLYNSLVVVYADFHYMEGSSATYNHPGDPSEIDDLRILLKNGKVNLDITNFVHETTLDRIKEELLNGTMEF